jgi:DNA-binding SARP family transcriptional activator
MAPRTRAQPVGSPPHRARTTQLTQRACLLRFEPVRAGFQMRLLGPFEARLEGGDVVSLGGLRQRALLAILTLHANEVVSVDRLIDELWGEHPPSTGVHTVQVFVSRLRTALGSAGERLITRSPGYVLELGVDEIDAVQCERLYSSACAALAAGEAGDAAARLRDAAALWRGPPLADFTYEPFAQAAIARLEELRVSCREELVEAELALGRHAELVADLEAFVREHPFRERPRGQLMLALYRSGRQAEALEAFHQARRALVDELGVEPSGALRELEQAILQQDESLRAPSQLPTHAAPKTERDEGSNEPAGAEIGPKSEIVRRSATVLVAELEPAADGDPERARTLVRFGRDRAEGLIARHGGNVVAGLGGEVVAVFGLPITREDDALRALSAADAVRSDLTTDSGAEAGGLLVRVGVDSGEVVGEVTGDLFGEPLANAIALARTAKQGEVAVSDATRYLASGGIQVEQADGGTGWRLLGLVVGGAARELVRIGPMVGRDTELSAAKAAFALTTTSGATHLLTVIGDAGIGKSRLCEEFLDQLSDQATVLHGRCLSYGDGIPLWPLREAVAEAAGGESREAIRGLLEDDEDADLVADIVAAALGLAPAQGIGEQVEWAFRRLLEDLASRHPTVLVINDAHWADGPLLDLLDYLVDWLTAPVLVLCLARPDLLELRPTWGGGRARIKSVMLSPLGEEDALRLLGHQLGERQLSAEHRARILERAEGNPLFMEQLLAMSAEDPWWSEKSDVPATLQGLLAARLDRLGPGERALIERAAVIGRGFWPGAVIEMLPAQARASADQHLRTLVRRGLIHPERSTVPGHEELRFHHILIRDVTYRSTPKALRAELHERFADWLVARGAGSEEFVGYHLEQAVMYRRELGGAEAQIVELARRAAESLTLAGRRSFVRGDANAAIKLLRRSAELSDLSHVTRPDVLLDLGVALAEIGEFEESERVLETALEQSRKAAADALSARVSIELSAHRSLVDPSTGVEETLTVANRAIEVFNSLGDEGGLARAWEQIALVHWIRCRCAEMEEVLERALEHAERAGEQLQQSRILAELASATVFGPRPVGDGIRRCSAILDRAHDDPRLSSITETMLAVLEAMQGEFDTARDRWLRAKQRLQEVGLGVTLAALAMYRAFIELMAGTPEKAESEVVAACEVLERAGDRDRLATVAALLGRILYAQARYDEAERYTVLSEECASADDVGSQVLWRGTRAKARARAGDPEAAAELAATAVALAAEGDLLTVHADALTDRAEVMSLLGRPMEAIRDLDEAIALYDRKGVISSIDASRRVRESLAAVTGAAAALGPT